jgi:hypothetical protein
MAYEFWDGFDHYDSAHEMWDFVNNGGGNPSTVDARFPAATNCVSRGVHMGLAVWRRKNLSGNRAGLIISVAFGISSLAAATQNFLQFLDNGTIQCGLYVTSTGAIGANRGGTSLGLSIPGLISATSAPTYFLDIVVTFGNGTGTVNVYLSTPAGGSPILSLSGINNIQSANAYANQVQIGELSGNIVNVYFDDFHCHTNAGAAPNTVLGEGTRIYTKLPKSVGFATTLTPNGAAANWQCVSDTPPDDDTTYVSAASFPLTEGYGIGAAGFTGTVNGVTRRSRIRKDDGAAHTFQNGVRSGTTNALGTAANVQSTYGWVDSFFATDPATTVAWTSGGADAASPIITAAS